MRKKRKPEEHGFNVWRSYSDMMAGVLLLFVLIMCVTLFQAQKSYQDSLKERDEKIALQEKYTEELLEKQGMYYQLYMSVQEKPSEDLPEGEVR